MKIFTKAISLMMALLMVCTLCVGAFASELDENETESLPLFAEETMVENETEPAAEAEPETETEPEPVVEEDIWVMDENETETEAEAEVEIENDYPTETIPVVEDEVLVMVEDECDVAVEDDAWLWETVAVTGALDENEPEAQAFSVIEEGTLANSCTVVPYCDDSFDHAIMPTSEQYDAILNATNRVGGNCYSSNSNFAYPTGLYTCASDDICVNLIWDDCNNADGIRPTNIGCALFYGGYANGDEYTMSEGELFDKYGDYSYAPICIRYPSHFPNYTVEYIGCSLCFVENITFDGYNFEAKYFSLGTTSYEYGGYTFTVEPVLDGNNCVTCFNVIAKHEPKTYSLTINRVWDEGCLTDDEYADCIYVWYDGSEWDYEVYYMDIAEDSMTIDGLFEGFNVSTTNPVCSAVSARELSDTMTIRDSYSTYLDEVIMGQDGNCSVTLHTSHTVSYDLTGDCSFDIADVLFVFKAVSNGTSLEEMVAKGYDGDELDVNHDGVFNIADALRFFRTVNGMV